MRLCEEKKIIPLLESIDINAGVDSDSIDMKDLYKVAFLITFCSDLAGDAVLKLYEGATHGAKATALTFKYRYGGAAIKSANADVLSTEAESAALTLTGTTFVSRTLVVEIEASAMTDGMRYLTLNFSDAASAGSVTVVAIGDPRYMSPAEQSVID